MANPSLTDNFIKSLIAPAGKRIEIFDQKISGLVLRVSGQGRKTWVLRYRTDNGRQPRFTIGTYPALKLAEPPMLPPDKNGDAKPVGLTRAMGIALQLAIPLLVRANEVGGMRVDELNFETRTWLIPGNRMKAGLPHLVPLPEKAIELIQEALALRPSQKLEHVFPSPRWHVENKGFRPDSIYHAMIELFTAKKIKHATPHDLRRTGSTALTSERIAVVGNSLNHRTEDIGMNLAPVEFCCS